jgi:vacuolar-type H+-ATPase subunit I/STV1
MKYARIAIAVPVVVFALFSCSTTGFMGLAKEEAVAELDEKRAREIEELKIQIERIDSLSEELEEALAEVKRAKTDAARAMELTKANVEESRDIEKELKEFRQALRKLDRKIAYLPQATIEKLIRILKEYSGDDDDSGVESDVEVEEAEG